MSESEKSEIIKNYLICRLKFTPRRLLFEEFNAKLRLVGDEENFEEKTPEIVSTKKYDFNALRQLRDFRSINSTECMSEFNLRKHQEKIRNEEKFLEHSCIPRENLNSDPIKSNESGQSLCLLCGKPTANKNDHKGPLVIKKNIKTERETPKPNKTCQIYIENSFALMHQKMK